MGNQQLLLIAIGVVVVGIMLAVGMTWLNDQATATKKTCARPAGVMEQETQYLKALATAATYRMDGDRLELRTADGALAVTLSAAGNP